MARKVSRFLPLSIIVLLLPHLVWGQALRETAPLPGAPRAGASAVLFADTQRIFVYGGIGGDRRFLEELWAYDLGTDRWQSIPKANPWPGPRAGHCVALDATGRGFFLYGGRAIGEPDFRCGNEIWHYEFLSRQWALVESGLRDAPDGQQSGMSVDPMTGDPWIFFGACGVSNCNWYFARFDRSRGEWAGSDAPRDSIPGGSTSSAIPYDPGRHAMLVRGGIPPHICLFSPEAPDAGRFAAVAPTLHSLWAFDPQRRAWEGIGAIAGSPARQRLPLAAYDPVSDSYLEYGGSRGPVGVASDSLWAFDLASQTWSLLGRSRPRFAAAGAYCPCTGELFVASGADSSELLSGVRSDAYFLAIEKPAQFEWDGPAGPRNAPWRWGALTLEEDGEIQPGSVRLMNCAAAKDLQGADDVKHIGRDRWHVRFRAASTEEDEALAAGHLVVTGRVQGQPVNFLERLSGSQVTATHPSPLRCDPVAGGWRIQYTGDHPEQARVQVFDVAGRMLARLDGPFSDGRSFVWDGRDGEGRRLANGIYFLRASGSRDAAKVVMIR